MQRVRVDAPFPFLGSGFTRLRWPDATDALRHVHDRCPVILPGRFADFWLDTDLKDKEGVQKLLLNDPEPHLVLREVDKKVESVRNNGPELIEAVTEPTALFKAGE